MEKQVCKNCNGLGSFKCTECGGTGSRMTRNLEMISIMGYAPKFLAKCTRCEGIGWCKCSFCKGTGRVDT